MIFHQDIIHQSNSLSYRFSSQDFELDYWRKLPETLSLNGGRGGSLKITIDRQSYVLHRYLRGGMIARFLQDRYVWAGESKTRPFLEYQVVQFAREQRLPVPEMVAYYVHRSGPFYRAASISRYLDTQGALAEYITQKQLEPEGWNRLGGLIKKFHQHGICHVDLNANNILIDFNLDFHLIDFDKATLNNAGNDWKTENLDRLKRSLLKIQGKLRQQQNSFYFSDEDWSQLIRGYQSR